MPNTLDILTIGDATVDVFLHLDQHCTQCQLQEKRNLLCLNYADKICVNHVEHAVGGNAANVAVATKKLGMKSAIMCEIGGDLYGQRIVDDLKSHTIPRTYVKHLKTKQTRFSVILNYKKERTVLSYHAPRSYSFSRIPKTNSIYYTSLGHGFERIQKKIITYKKNNKDSLLIVNPGSHQMQHISSFGNILPHADILFVNKEEAIQLIGRRHPIPTLLRSLQQLGIHTVVITDAKQGSYAYDGTEMLHMPVFPVSILAKTGAGDAYASACVYAISKKKSLADAMKFGTANASGVMQKTGAHHGLQTASSIKKILQEYAHITPKKL